MASIGSCRAGYRLKTSPGKSPPGPPAGGRRIAGWVRAGFDPQITQITQIGSDPGRAPRSAAGQPPAKAFSLLFWLVGSIPESPHRESICVICVFCGFFIANSSGSGKSVPGWSPAGRRIASWIRAGFDPQITQITQIGSDPRRAPRSAAGQPPAKAFSLLFWLVGSIPESPHRESICEICVICGFFIANSSGSGRSVPLRSRCAAPGR